MGSKERNCRGRGRRDEKGKGAVTHADLSIGFQTDLFFLIKDIQSASDHSSINSCLWGQLSTALLEILDSTSKNTAMKHTSQKEPQPRAAARKVSKRTDLLYPPKFFYSALTAVKTFPHLNTLKIRLLWSYCDK